MKVEGTPEELRDLIETKGFDPKDFFKGAGKPEGGLAKGWIAAPVVLFVACCVVSIFWPPEGRWFLGLSVAGLFAACWFTVCAHIKWKQATITGLSPILAVIILMVSSSQMSFADALDRFDKYYEADCKKEEKKK